MAALYDTIGKSYGGVRRPDPYWRRHIDKAIGHSGPVLNIGAGTGSYEPRTQGTVAVEPSFTMIRQRDAGAAPAVQGVAEALPFRDDSFALAMSVLSIHHWQSRTDGFEEIGRVATQKAVFVTWDPAHDGFWLTRDYFPEIVHLDRKIFPAIAEFRSTFGNIEVAPLLIPNDCADGFLGAYWQRPEAFLDETVRAGMSSFAKLSSIADGIARLRVDLESGEWRTRNRHLIAQAFADIGYRIVIANL